MAASKKRKSFRKPPAPKPQPDAQQAGAADAAAPDRPGAAVGRLALIWSSASPNVTVGFPKMSFDPFTSDTARAMSASLAFSTRSRVLSSRASERA